MFVNRVRRCDSSWTSLGSPNTPRHSSIAGAAEGYTIKRHSSGRRRSRTCTKLCSSRKCRLMMMLIMMTLMLPRITLTYQFSPRRRYSTMRGSCHMCRWCGRRRGFSCVPSLQLGRNYAWVGSFRRGQGGKCKCFAGDTSLLHQEQKTILGCRSRQMGQIARADGGVWRHRLRAR